MLCLIPIVGGRLIMMGQHDRFRSAVLLLSPGNQVPENHLAKEPSTKRVQTLSVVNGTFKIPPGDPNYRVDASFEIRKEVILASIHPQMHSAKGF